MVKNKNLSRKIIESSWGNLSSMIEYKSAWFGKTYYRINQWSPSSKTCNTCGFKIQSLSLNIRHWKCSVCEKIHDRDINAAINIKNIGQINLYNQKISDATADLGEIPVALQKMVHKIERSDNQYQLTMGVGKINKQLVDNVL